MWVIPRVFQIKCANNVFDRPFEECFSTVVSVISMASSRINDPVIDLIYGPKGAKLGG